MAKGFGGLQTISKSNAPSTHRKRAATHTRHDTHAYIPSLKAMQKAHVYSIFYQTSLYLYFSAFFFPLFLGWIRRGR